jgi:hypothetical protein
VESVTLELDGFDVTSGAEVTESGISYVPSTDLSEGKHTVTLVVSDRSGNTATSTWTFSVKPPEPAKPAETPAPSKCVIATAAYGSELSPEVQLLRNFRDEVILSTYAGEHFMKVFNAWYYSFSPKVASFIASRPSLRASVRAMLYPLIGILKISSYAYSIFSFSPELGVLMAGLTASSLIGLTYFAIPLTMILAAVKRLRERALVIRSKEVGVMTTIWMCTLALVFIAEIATSPGLMMLSTASFVVVTLCLPAIAVATRIQRYLS